MTTRADITDAVGSIPLTGWLWLAALAATWTLAYLTACWRWPFADCLRCNGSGKHEQPAWLSIVGGRGRSWRSCRRCNGSGKRVRFGRRIYNRLRAKDAA